MIQILETTQQHNEAQNTPFRRPIRVVIQVSFVWVFLHMLGAFVVLMAQKRYEEMFPVLILSIFLSIVDRWMWMEFLKIFKELGEKRKDKTDVQEGDEYQVFFTDQVLNDKNECSICLTSSLLIFKKSICGHVFHEECVKKWFLNQKTNSLPMSCPICRRSGFVSKRMESILLQV